MAIQNRRGVYSDFTPTKMVPGEFAVVNSGDPNSTSGKGVYISFADGQAKRLVMEEDVQNEVAKATEDIAEQIEDAVADDLEAAQAAATTASTKASEAAASATQAAQTVANIIDNTLSQTGKAADAKVTGDELAGVKEDLNSIENDVEQISDQLYIEEGETVSGDIFTGEFISTDTINIVAEDASKIFHSQKNLFRLFNRTKGSGGAYNPSTLRNFSENNYYNGFYATGACNGDGYSAVEYSQNGIIVTAGASGGGGGNGCIFPLRLPATKTYTLSASICGGVKLMYYDNTGLFQSYEQVASSPNETADISFSFTPPEGAYWTVLHFSSHATLTFTYDNIQIEKGGTASQYEAYHGEMFDSDIESIEAYSGLNNIWVDDGSFALVNTKVPLIPVLASRIEAAEDDIEEINASISDISETTDVEYNNAIFSQDMQTGHKVNVSTSGDPNQIIHTKKNLFNLFGRTKGVSPGSSASTQRAFKPDEYYNGFYATGSSAGDGYSSLEYIEDGAAVNKGTSGGGGGYGTIFPIHLPTGKKYTLSMNEYGSFHISYYNASGAYMSYQAGLASTAEATDKTFTFIPPEGAYWTVLLLQNHLTKFYQYKNIQIEEGETATAYEECEFEALQSNVETIDAYDGTNSIWVDKGILVVKKNVISQQIADLNDWKEQVDPLIEKLENNVIARNLDVLPVVQACVSYGIHSAGAENTKRSMGILVTTDIHAREQVLKNAIEYFNEYPYIDIGMCLGDIAGSYYSDTDGSWYTSIVNTSEKPFYTILGNHDGGNDTSASHSATVADQFAKWIQPTLGTMGMPSLTIPYYAIHDATYGISIICLASYDVPDTKSGNDFVVSRSTNAYSQAQIDWFINELNNIPQYNHLVLVQHEYAGATVKQESIWSQKWGDIANHSSYGEMIADIINAWKNNLSINDTYTTEVTGLPSINVSADFTSRSPGVFACHLVGHVHRDYYCKSQKYSDQTIISLVCTADGLWQGENNDLPRVDNTKSQDAFTIVSINKIRRTINLTRVGSNKTISMTDRTMFAIPY